MKTTASICVVIASLMSSAAWADCNLFMIGISVQEVAVFNDSGKRLDKKPSTAIVPSQRIQNCNEDYGLVEVLLVDGNKVWIDRAVVTVKAGGDKQNETEVCARKFPSAPADQKEHVTSGIGSAKNCP